MRLSLFVVGLCVAVFVERRALRLGYRDVARRQFEAVSVFLAGGLLAGVIAAIVTVTVGVPSSAGFVAFVVLLVIDIQMLVTHNRDASSAKY